MSAYFGGNTALAVLLMRGMRGRCARTVAWRSEADRSPYARRMQGRELVELGRSRRWQSNASDGRQTLWCNGLGSRVRLPQ